MPMSASVSLGKHEPPHPGPAAKNAADAVVGADCGEHVRSIGAELFANGADSVGERYFGYKQAFDAYFMSSAVRAETSILGERILAYRLSMVRAAAGSSEPITMRSGP